MLSVNTRPIFDYHYYFSINWILGNSLAHGIGLGLPLFFGDFSAGQVDLNIVTIAVLTFSIWVGIIQWLALRSVIPVSVKWILATALSPLLAFVTVGLLAFIAVPLAFLFYLFYPLAVSLTQWWVLRQVLRPVRAWIVASVVAIAIGIMAGIFAIAIGTMVGTFSVRVLVLIGGTTYGAVYGIITLFGLQYLSQRENVVFIDQDSSQNSTPPNANRWPAAIASGAIAIGVFCVWLPLLPPLSSPAVRQIASWPPWVALPFLLGTLLLYMFVAVLVHEMGHLLFALSQGFELKAFAVDKWVVTRRGKSWRVRKTHKRFAGGFVEPVPKSRQVFSKRSLIVMIAGGPIASLLFFGVSAIPLLFPTFVSTSPLGFYIAFLAGMSLYMAIFNAVPLEMGYLRLDGRRILDIASNNLQGQRFAALYGFNASIREGLRPKEIESSLVQKVLSLSEESMDHISGLLLAYKVAIDTRDYEKAGDYLDQALKIQLHYPELYRGMLLLEGAYYEAYIRDRPDVARKWFNKIVETAMIAPYSLLRAESAVLLAEGRVSEALAKAEQGMVSIGRDRFMKGEAVAEEDYLLELLQAIDSTPESTMPKDFMTER